MLNFLKRKEEAPSGMCRQGLQNMNRVCFRGALEHGIFEGDGIPIQV